MKELTSFLARLIVTATLATLAWATFLLAGAEQSWLLCFFAILLLWSLVGVLASEWRRR